MTVTTLALSPRYSGIELIATGGMADVYVATDESLDRLVAVKALNERFARDPEIRTRFTREARIAAKLSAEPNVVTIYDVTEAGDTPAIVMEFLPGGTLADRMRAKRVPPALALAWLEQAARALDAAHAAGVVHRDVKPANLMLDADGNVRVTDFGIARIAGDVSLTSVGTILGTSGYMSPEQAVGGTATAASDGYGLAVVAFELLSGRRPYQAESFAAEAAAHATAPIPAATQFDPWLPPAIDAVFRRGLAKDPEQRYRSCGELVADLRATFAESAGTTVRTVSPAVPSTAPAAPPSRATSRLPRVLALLLLLAGVAVVGVLSAGLLDRGGNVAQPTTVVRTATVAGRQVVRTVTVEGRQVERTVTVSTPAATPTPPAEETPTPPTTATPPTSGTGTSGAALNDQGYRLLQSGNPTEALPILEQAIAALQGSGSLAEAYASYNLALARFSTGSCDGVTDLLRRSKEIQGKRHEIDQLQRDVDKRCEH